MSTTGNGDGDGALSVPGAGDINRAPWTKPEGAEFETPREEYIYSPVKISLVALAAKWKVTYRSLIYYCRRHHWVNDRKRIQEGLVLAREQQIYRSARTAVTSAVRRHARLGKMLQDDAEASLKEVGANGLRKLQPERYMEAVYGMRQGVDIERSAMGDAVSIASMILRRFLDGLKEMDLPIDVVGKISLFIKRLLAETEGDAEWEATNEKGGGGGGVEAEEDDTGSDFVKH